MASIWVGADIAEHSEIKHFGISDASLNALRMGRPRCPDEASKCPDRDPEEKVHFEASGNQLSCELFESFQTSLLMCPATASIQVTVDRAGTHKNACFCSGFISKSKQYEPIGTHRNPQECLLLQWFHEQKQAIGTHRNP